MTSNTRARTIAIALLGAWFAVVTPGQAQAQAQNAVISGKVVSEFGQAVEGANVFIAEMAISVGTNAQGNYTITVPAARVQDQSVNLRVRAVGFQPQVRPVRLTAGTQTFNFTMKQDVNRLDEVVVTGTVEGVERAKVPFAVARLATEDMPVPALDPLRQLSGKIPGMRIAQTSGRPGATPEIMMRGPTSINGTGRDRGPLIIVDGAILNVGSIEELGALDIESVEVVKGAAGASLYGTRAANGVITIKTKRGSNQDGVKINVRSEYGISDINSVDYGMPINHQLQLDESGTRFCVVGTSNIAPCSRTFDWMTEIYRINNVATDTLRTPVSSQWNSPAVSGGELVNVFQSQYWPGHYFNPLAQVVTTNPTSLQAVDASGRAAGVRYFVSGSYQDEEGSVKGLRGIQSRRARVNLDYDLRQDATVSISSMYDLTSNDLRSGGSSNGGIFGQLLRGATMGTDYLARDTLGRYLVRSGGASLHTPTGNGAGTFLYDSENLRSQRESQRYLANITTSYFPKEWVTVEATAAYDRRFRKDQFYQVKGYRTFSEDLSQNLGNASYGNRDEDSFNGSLTSTFRRQLRSDLNGKLQVRALYDEDNVVLDASSGERFVVKDVYTTTNTTTNKTASSSSQSIRNLGYLAGTSLDYKDRYIFDATFRYDGSSLFGSGNRWAPFGRVSGVWRVSEEPWYNVPHLSDFRLRLSRGTAGSTPRFDAQYETYNIGTGGSISLGQFGNSKLKPETTTETELGTDFTLWDRLGVELTNAVSSTKDQILLVSTPGSLGFSRQWQNAGTLQNKTWELGLNLPVINRRDFSWSMRGTWDRTRTVVSELFAPEFVFDAGTGQGTGSFFRITAAHEYLVNGVDKSNGFQVNRFGNIWGRKFYRKCSDLPTIVQPNCGDNKMFQVNDEGWVVFVQPANGMGYSWRDGITKNLWGTQLPACVDGAQQTAPDACMASGQSPWGIPVQFGHPIIDRPLNGEPNEGIGISQILGNVFPDFRFGYSNNVQWKKFTFYGLIEGTIGQDIYNQGEGWGLLDISSTHFDQAGKSVETAKPLGYSWRVGAGEGAGTGGFYDQLGPNNYVVENGSFAKIREMSVTYRVGAVRGVGDWTVGLVGRNLATFTKYSGLDPEIGATGGSTTQGTGSGLINQVDAFGFPTLRTFTFSVSSRF